MDLVFSTHLHIFTSWFTYYWNICYTLVDKMCFFLLLLNIFTNLCIYMSPLLTNIYNALNILFFFLIKNKGSILHLFLFRFAFSSPVSLMLSLLISGWQYLSPETTFWARRVEPNPSLITQSRSPFPVNWTVTYPDWQLPKVQDSPRQCLTVLKFETYF